MLKERQEQQRGEQGGINMGFFGEPQEPQQDRIDTVFQQLGLSQPDTTPLGFGGAGRGTPLVTSPTTPVGTPARTEEVGAVRQFTHGMSAPFRPLAESVGLIDDHPLPGPVNLRERVFHGAGSLLSWVGIGVATAATAGKAGAAIATPALAKAGIAGKGLNLATAATKFGIGGAITDAYRGWTEDKTPEETLRMAMIGGGVSAAIPFMGPAARKVGRVPAVADSLDRLGDVARKLRPGAQALPHQRMGDVQSVVSGLPDKQAGELMGEVKRRVSARGADTRLAKQINNFSQIDERSQLRALTDIVKSNPDDVAVREAMRPVFKHVKKLDKTAKGVGVTSLGDPRNPKEYRNVLNRLGAEKSPEHVTKILKNRYGITTTRVRTQLNQVDNKIRHHYGKMNEILEDNRVWDPNALSSAAHDQWAVHAKTIDRLDEARMMLLPSVEDVLGKARSGDIASSFTKKLSRDYKKVRAATTTPIEEYHPRLIGELQKHGVASPDQLTAAARRNFDTIAEELTSRGIPLKEEIGSYMNPTLISQKDAKSMMGEMFRLPAPKMATSLDDELLRKSMSPYAKHFTPSRYVLGEPVARELRTSKLQYDKFVDDYLSKARNVLKPLRGRKGAKQREEITETLWKMRKPEELTPQARKAYDEIQDMFRLLAKEFNIPKEELIENYAPRRAADGMLEFSWMKKVPEKLKFFAEESRTGFLSSRDTDIFKLLNTYVRGGAKKKFFGPAFKELDGHMAIKGIDPTRKEYYETVKRSMMGYPTQMETMLDDTIANVARALGGRDTQRKYTREISSFLLELQYTGTLGGNIFSAVKNLSQQLLSVSTLDPNPMVGIEYWFRAKQALMTKFGREMADTNSVMTSRMPREGLSMQESVLQKLPYIGEKLSRGHKKLSFGMFSAADKSNVNTAYMMKLLHSLDKNKPFQHAVEDAYSHTMATQFMYGIDSPALFKGPVGKAAGALMSWPLNWANLLHQQASHGSKVAAASTVAAMAVGSEALSTTGLNFRSINPARVASGIWPAAMVQGEDNFPILLRAGTAGTSHLWNLAQGDEEAIEVSSRNFKRHAKLMVPFMVQGERFKESYDAMRNDWKVLDERGRTSYDMGLREGIQNLIGPTVDSRRRVDELNQINEQQSAYRARRGEAIDAFFDGDMEEFQKQNAQLEILFGTSLEPQDIEQEMELRGMTATERRAIGLPQTMREPLLERMSVPQR